MYKFPRFLTHVLLGISFLGLIYVYTPEDNLDWAHIKNNPNELSNLLAYFLMLSLFYLNYYWLVPRFFLADKFWNYFAWLTFGFVFIYLFSKNIPWQRFVADMKPPSLYAPAISPKGAVSSLPSEAFINKPPFAGHRQMPPIGKFDVGKLLILYLIGIFFSTLLRNNQYRNQLEKQRIETDLRYLKAQINPHFLFNSLNSIYALTLTEGATQSSEALVRLSGMMRYVLTDAEQNFVMLSKELDYINNYINLQKLRFGDTVEIHIDCIGEPNGKKIAPMILISLIENAFKYGVNPEVKSSISIEITIGSELFTLKVQNKKVRLQHTHAESTGLGLENPRQRLVLLYAAKHKLTIQETPEEYSVELCLNLTA